MSRHDKKKTKKKTIYYTEPALRYDSSKSVLIPKTLALMALSLKNYCPTDIVERC